MDHMFTLTGTTLTVHLPSEVDHHSTELLQRETDQLIQSRNIRCILLISGIPCSWTALGSECCSDGIK